MPQARRRVITTGYTNFVKDSFHLGIPSRKQQEQRGNRAGKEPETPTSTGGAGPAKEEELKMMSRCSGRHCSSPCRFVRQTSQQRRNTIVRNLIRRTSTLVYILCYSISISRVRPLSVDTSFDFGSYTRRSAIGTSVATFLGGGSAKATTSPLKTKDVVKVATGGGLRYKQLGGSDIIVSEVGIGTQRWGSTDFNAPDEYLCHAFMDRAIFDWGVNLIDTAEQCG